MRRTVLACIATALLVGGGTATARVLITSSDIKDGTIKTVDINNGTIKHDDIKESTITRDRLEKKVRRLLNEQGAAGPKGDVGPAGPRGLVNSTFDADAPATTTAAVQANFADFTGGSLIRDLTLPAGSYHIEATSSVRGATDGPAAPPSTRACVAIWSTPQQAGSTWTRPTRTSSSRTRLRPDSASLRSRRACEVRRTDEARIALLLGPPRWRDQCGANTLIQDPRHASHDHHGGPLTEPRRLATPPGPRLRGPPRDHCG